MKNKFYIVSKCRIDALENGSCLFIAEDLIQAISDNSSKIVHDLNHAKEILFNDSSYRRVYEISLEKKLNL